MKKTPKLISDIEISGLLSSAPKRDGIRYKQSNRSNIIKFWRRAYFYTASVLVLSVLLIFMCEFGNLTELENKIINFFAGIDFIGGAQDDTVKDPQHDQENPPSNNNFGESTPPKEDGDNGDTKPPDVSTDVDATVKDIYDYDISLVPEGHTPIIPMDLSLSHYGSKYINNATGYTPDISALLMKDFGNFLKNGINLLSASTMPKVLIVHTHGTEAYSEEGATFCPNESVGMRSSNVNENVVAIGKLIADELNSSGIPTAHCTVMHDSIQYKDSYARAEETIREYIERYPSIELVIDIHRDAVLKSSGELIRPVAEKNGEALGQVMFVVGSDWSGEECPSWENNLALALKMREALNSKCYNLCRPVNLKGNTYNQEIAKYSLLIEVGASGNSLAEAQRSAKLIAESLMELVNKN